MKLPPTRRRRGDRRRASIAAVFARPLPAVAVRYPGYLTPDLDHRTRQAITGAALLHGAAIAVLFALASMAPRVEDHILRLTLLEPEPEPPPPVEVPKPEPPPPPVRVELPRPELPKLPPPKPAPRPEPPPAPPKPPVVKPPVVKPEPLLPAAPIAPPAPLPAPARAARPSPVRESAVRMPAAQIDRMDTRPEFAGSAPAATHRPALPAPRAERAVRLPPAEIDRVAVARPEAALEAPALRAAPPPPRPARAERPGFAAPSAAPAPRHQLRGVALSELLPCTSDARELALKQRTVAAAQNRALCESPAGRFHFVETKNVNAFLMRIEQAAGRRSGDRCDELELALDCIASLPPPRSRR